MTEQKLKKITIASTVTAVVLLAVLLFVLAFQIISIIVKKNELKKYDEQIIEYNKLISEKSEELDIYQADWKIQARARELGYKFPGDVDVTN